MYTVIIVESPTKARLIQNVLGPTYRCIASNGHFRELDVDSLRIDSLRIDSLRIDSLRIDSPNSNIVDNVNDPPLTYKIIPSKKVVVSRIKKCIEGSSLRDNVILATDDDREGETIAWHLCQVLHLNVNTTRRIIIHEMTKTAIENAILPINIKNVNMNIVRSQQTRQFIDVIVGYKISPILWKRIKDDKKRLSAGRCQTPALRLVYETMANANTLEEDKFIYKTIGYFTSKNIAFSLDRRFETKDEVMLFLTNSITNHYTIKSRELKNSTMPLKKPFTTSYLLQTASSELKIAPKEVMESCQLLFENGYITYMRTDGTIYADSFVKESETYIKKKYGDKYVLSDIVDINNNNKNSNKSVICNSSPHEPIRPTNVQLEEIKESDIITSREIVLYKLIHKHSIQTLMLPPIHKTLTVCISSSSAMANEPCDLYSYATDQILFDGYNIVNSKKNEPNSTFTFLQTIKVGSTVPYNKIYCKQVVGDEDNKCKRKFTESSLIGKLEVLGIGRPSTYSTIIDVIQKRGYVKKENKKGKIVDCVDYFIENTTKAAEEIAKCVSNRETGNENGKLFIQPVGVKIVEFINKHFKSIFEYEYTKRMECDLDLISRGEIGWMTVWKRCLLDITAHIDELEKYTFTEQDTDDNKEVKEACNESASDDKRIGMYKGIPIYVKYGKYGRYIDYDNKMISLDRSIYSIQEAQAIHIIENNYERIIDNEVSIRNGKYSDYIYHKKVGRKPVFYKLDGFVKTHGIDSYKTCNTELFSSWFYDMIKETKKNTKNP